MKVIYFSQDYTPHDYRFLEKLAETQYGVWYLRFETNPAPFETRPAPPGIRVIDWMGNQTYRVRGWDKLKLFLEFRRILRQIQPDLIHAGPVQSCGFFTALAGFKPLLLMSWGSDILVEANKNAISRWIARFTLRRAALIACDCLAVRDSILKLVDYPADKIIVFPWGVDLKQFRPATSKLKLRDKLGWKDNKVVVTTRSLEPVYGIKVLLEAMKKVIAETPDTRILMLGDGSLASEVKTFIAHHNLGHVFHLPGRVQHNQLPDYFNEADIYVSSSYSDGTSVSLLEAMACKLPVVVTDLPSNREWVTPGSNGWLVSCGDSQALSVALQEALQDNGKRKVMADANLCLAQEKADWDKNSAVLLKAYEQLAGRY